MPSITTRSGQTVAYEEAGSTEPALVFVHGWCCDHTYFSPQFEYFASSHRVIAMDLPGFGKSDPVAPVEIGAYAAAVAEVCTALDLNAPVVVGHSMGGITAMEVAAQAPDLPGAVVLVDPAPIDPPEETRSLLAGLTAQLEGDRDGSARRDFIAAFLFGPADDPDRKAHIIESMSSVDAETAFQAFAAMSRWDGRAAAARIRVPVLCLLAGATGINTPAHVHSLLPDADIGVTVGAGHFHQLEVPAQVNAMIERFLEVGRGAV